MRVSRMAWRNVRRNPRRTAVTVGAMATSLLGLLLYAGLMEGMLSSFESDAVNLEVGDLQIFAGDYRENPSIFTRLEGEPLVARLEAEGFEATPRLLAFGLAAHGESSAGVSFRGVDVERDRDVSGVYAEIAEGAWLDPSDPKGVVLGRRLARSLSAGIGDEVLVLGSGADGSMAYDLFRVRGVLRGVGGATDMTGVFLLAPTFRELMAVSEGVHQLIVRRPPELPLPAAAARAAELAPGEDVKTWKELLPTLASMVEAGRQMLYFVFVIVYVAVAILILNAMLMSVFERVRELGVLKAIGVTPFQVVRLIAYETAIQLGIALVIGLVLSVPLLYYLTEVGIEVGALGGIDIVGVAMNTTWRTKVVPAVYVGPIVTLFGIVALAVVYPALKAALIQPIDAIPYH